MSSDFQRCRFYNGTFGKNCQKLRQEHNFHGYIHLKTIPGASDELMKEAGLYADRLSINLEIPTESGLKLLAPEKSHEQMTKPMNFIKMNWFYIKKRRNFFEKSPEICSQLDNLPK